FPEVRFPAFVNDGASAVAWVARNIAGYGGSPERIHLMGHSAGAHIAAMLAYDPTYLQASGAGDIRVERFIGLSGPYDFLPLKLDYLKDVFPEALRQQSQPINFVSADAPPTLLIHGSADDVVLSSNSESLAQALSQSGTPVELRLYEGVGHARVVAALAPPLGFTGSTLEDAIAFIGAAAKLRDRTNQQSGATVVP
ncbi:MAG: alpha/beta hydrolase, partial [Gammaproteobacteria bacterium]|nr:alpha/beta hydrolase [Gammaproteobacteria bacterium]